MKGFLTLIAGTFFSLRVAHAADVQLTNPLGADNLQTMIANVAPALIAIAAPIATIMVLYGAFLMITSAGNEERISTGRKTILYAAVGFLAVLLASSVVPVIMSIFNQ
ncbi:MAG: hypothetical protein NUV53_00760 [Patescibacteria group bacterium]|nr:hypothetical protein [Patescibacteria group bacterium]